jgi:hypothetical protein
VDTATFFLAIAALIAAVAAIPKSQLRMPAVLICAICLVIASVSFVHFRTSANEQAAPATGSIQPSAAATSASVSAVASNTAPTSASVSAVAPSTPAASSALPSGQSAPLAVKPQYRSVSLAALCSNGESYFEYCGVEQTQKIGQSEYVFSTDAQVYPGDSPQLSFASTTCRNLSLRFAIGGDDSEPSELEITVTVVSQGSQSAVVKPDQLGTLNTNLSGGPFEIDVSASMGNINNGSGWALLMDGSASCTTDSGS